MRHNSLNKFKLVSTRIKHIGFTTMLLLSFILLGCKKDDEPAQTITIEASSDVIIGINNQLQLSATIDGTPLTGPLTWTSSNVVSAEVNDQGLVTANKHGVVVITVTDGVSSGETTLQIFNVAGDATPEFDAEMVEYMRQYSVLGVGYAVVKDGKLVMARGYGLADFQTGEVVTPTSLFRIADVSKPFTAAAIMKLVDDGLLDLDEKMFTILLDKFPVVNLPDIRITDITVRQLLNHTSGIRGSNTIPQPMFNQADVAVQQGVSSPPSLDEMITWFADQTLLANPGEEYAFHNLNYMLLGRVIEAKTDMTYEEYVKTNILDPIEVTAPRIGLSHEADKFPREVSYYHPFTSNVLSVFDSDAGFVPFPYGGIGDVQNMDSHGGWIASVIDLARFALATDGNPATPEILTATSQQYMVEDNDSGIGSGWFVEDDNWNHSGLMPGTIATLYVKNDGTIIIGLLNSTHDFNGPFIQLQFEAFRDTMRELAESTTWPDRDLFSEY